MQDQATPPGIPVEPPRPRQNRRGSRTLVSSVVLLSVLPFLAWTLVRFLGLEAATSPWVQLMAFTPYLACLAVVPLLLALLSRRWWIAGVAAATCVSLLICVVPRTLPALGPGAGPRLRVLSVNMYEGRADADEIVNLVRLHDVDVLALQELTPGAERRLVEAGLSELLPYAEAHPIRGVDGSAVYSRLSVIEGDVKINPGAGFRQATAVIEVADVGTVTIESVHPVSPSDQRMVGFWAEGLREQTPASAGGARILVGDFNATLDHVELRRLVDTGYRDAAAEVGKGLTPTWPYDGRQYRLIPKITIDHALVSAGIGVESFSVFPVSETDHRAILATLVFAQA